MDRTKPDKRCQAITGLAQRCRAAALKDGVFCYFHARPGEAARLGRIGGRKNRHVPEGKIDPPFELKTLADVQNFLARMAAEVYEGKKDPRIAIAVKGLLCAWLQACGNMETQNQLHSLQNQFEELVRLTKMRRITTAIDDEEFIDLSSEDETEEARSEVITALQDYSSDQIGAELESGNGETYPNKGEPRKNYDSTPNPSSSSNSLDGSTKQQLAQSPLVPLDVEPFGNINLDSRRTPELQPVPGAPWQKEPSKGIWMPEKT